MQGAGGDPALGAGIAIVVILVWLFIIAVAIGFTVLVWWRIFSKAGYSGAMALLMLIPIAVPIMLLILAFSEWPIHRQMRQSGPGPGGG